MELREEKVLEFINLKQSNITVKGYSLKFTQLARYVPHVVVDNISKMSKYMPSMSNCMVKKVGLQC